jgi:hypothetical protein
MAFHRRLGKSTIRHHAKGFESVYFEENVSKKKTIKTERGDLVQSYGEKKIADYLYDKDIIYEYDLLMKLDEDEPNDKRFWVRPDFFISENKVVIEYWGMRFGRADNPTYNQRAEYKKALYCQEGFFLIEVFEEHLDLLDIYLKQKLIEAGVFTR